MNQTKFIGSIAAICLAAFANANAAEHHRSTYANANSTFGFSGQKPILSEEEQLKQIQEDREAKANYIVNSKVDLLKKHKAREIKQQESIIFVAEQKLHGKTPVYGEEREDLEKIIANAKLRIEQLKKESASIKSSQEEIDSIRQALNSTYPQLQENMQSPNVHGKNRKDGNIVNTSSSLMANNSSSFFDYGESQQSNDQRVNPNSRGMKATMQRNQKNTSLKAVDSVIKNLNKQGVNIGG